MRTPEHYRNKPSDLDKPMLKEIPEAPRTPRKPPSFNWSMFFDDDSANNVSLMQLGTYSFALPLKKNIPFFIIQNEPSLVQSVLASKHRSISNQELSTRPDERETDKLVAESVENIVDTSLMEVIEERQSARNSARSQRAASGKVS